MKTSDNIADLAAALATAQGEFTNPDRNRTVKVALRSGSSYQFAYATLDGILSVVRGPLSSHGLAVIQAVATESVEGQGVLVTVTTRLLHASGQWLESDMLAISPGEIQAIGSTITYLRRYSLVSLLAIAAEEDDDGNVAAGNQVQHIKSKKPAVSAEEDSYITRATAEILTASEEELLAMAEIIRGKSQVVRDALKVPYATRMKVLKTTEEVP